MHDLREHDLHRISTALELVAQLISQTDRSAVSVSRASNGDPVTSLDRKINEVLRNALPAANESWLSEESHDDLRRLQCSRVWIVDPIDGTREFVEGTPEWTVSVALVEDHEAVAGGVFNPSTGELFLGSRETGIRVSHRDGLSPASEREDSACVLVSRREFAEGKWRSFEGVSLRILPVGSIAYRLARVAAGYAGATCTFEQRSEWDVAAGVALVQAAGGTVQTLTGEPVRFNQEIPRLQNFFAFSKRCSPLVPRILRAATPAH
jgi:myo-inositol-1(or 4)-monophosphatase